MTDPTPEPATPQHGPIVTETAETKTTKPSPVLSKRARFRRWVLRLTLFLVIVSPLVFILAGLGAKFGIWSWQFGLSTLTRQVGPLLLAATLIMGIFSVLLAFFIKPRKGLIIAGLAIVIPLAAFVQLNSVRAKAGSLPLIHDITTDTQDPPTFGTVIMAERAATSGVNTVDYDGKRAPTADRDANGQPVTRLVSALQTQAYPEIRTLVLSVDPGIAFGRAEQVARDLGWEIKESDAAAGRIDATATTFWYGFKDDIAIRLRPASGDGTRVDIRSVSRVGLSDLGANAARIEAFLNRMKE